MNQQAAPFKSSFNLLLKTTPFLILNIAVYGGFFILSAIWLAIFGSIAFFFSTRAELLAYIFFIIAIAGPYSVLIFAKRYILYLVKGAHIAAITKLLKTGTIPEGQSQVQYGREIVQNKFRDVSILFVLDRLIDRTVRRFTNRFVRIVDFLPLGGGATQIARWISTIVKQSLTYVDEAILSYSIAKDEENVWNTARHGIILYAQSYKPVLITAVKVWVLSKVFYVTVLIVLGIPGILLMMFFNPIWFQILTLVAVLLLTSLITRAVFDPFAMTYTLITYHEAIEGVQVNQEWDERLQSVSKAFKDLVSRAKNFSGFGKTSEKTAVSNEPTTGTA